jgi:copper chaperone CopZ
MTRVIADSPGGTVMSAIIRNRSYPYASMVLADGTPGPLLPAVTAVMLTARFRIDGLTCAAEAARLEHRLVNLPGILAVTVNPINEIAYVRFDPALASTDRIKRDIEAAGFGATERR